MKLPAAAKYSKTAILMGALVMTSCTVTSVVLDRINNRAWLYDLAQHPTRTKWDKHIDEVVYLVSIGDRQALSAARILFPSVFQQQSRFPKSDVLAEEMYAVAKLNGVEKLPIEEQIAWIRYYDQHPPEAWRDVRNNYKRQHQEPFCMIPEPPEPIAAATEPSSQPTAVAAAATQPATAPAIIAAAPQHAPEAPPMAQAATRKAEPVTPIAVKPEIPAALQKVPQSAPKKTAAPQPAAPIDDKPTPPDSTF